MINDNNNTIIHYPKKELDDAKERGLTEYIDIEGRTWRLIGDIERGGFFWAGDATQEEYDEALKELARSELNKKIKDKHAIKDKDLQVEIHNRQGE